MNPKRILVQFRRVSKKWADRFADFKNNETDIEREISNYSNCAVGDFWGGSNRYRDECRTCYEISEKFGNLFESVEGQEQLTESQLKLINRFTKHCKENHREMMKNV